MYVKDPLIAKAVVFWPRWVMEFHIYMYAKSTQTSMAKPLSKPSKFVRGIAFSDISQRSTGRGSNNSIHHVQMTAVLKPIG
jgi:hypothetical protein